VIKPPHSVAGRPLRVVGKHIAAALFSRPARSIQFNLAATIRNHQQKGTTMACYITLLKFTEKGAKSIKNTATRANQFSVAARKAGVNVVAQ
jgi:hypothetical protein